MPDLCTLADAKAHLNIQSSNDDLELTTFITAASDLVEEYADKVWRDTTYTEIHDGGTDTLVLKHSPIKTLTSISEMGSVTTSFPTTDYAVYPETGVIRRFYYDFLGDRGQVTVVYTAGGTVPALARQATLVTLAHLWETQRGSMGRRNPLSGDDYPTGMSYSLPNRAMELLDRIAQRRGIG